MAWVCKCGNEDKPLLPEYHRSLECFLSGPDEEQARINRLHNAKFDLITRQIRPRSRKIDEQS